MQRARDSYSHRFSSGKVIISFFLAPYFRDSRDEGRMWMVENVSCFVVCLLVPSAFVYMRFVCVNRKKGKVWALYRETMRKINNFTYLLVSVKIREETENRMRKEKNRIIQFTIHIIQFTAAFLIFFSISFSPIVAPFLHHSFIHSITHSSLYYSVSVCFSFRSFHPHLDRLQNQREVDG